MYSLLVTLFLVGVAFVVFGFVARLGSTGGALGNVSANVASSLALLVVFALILISFSSFNDLAKVFSAICNGIPYVDKIESAGSLQNLLHTDPQGAAVEFLDSVVLAAIINVTTLLPLTSGSAVGRGRAFHGKFMVELLTGVVVAVISLLILNIVIHNSGPYKYIVSILGGVFSVLSIGSVPLMLTALVSNVSVGKAGFWIALLMFAKSKVLVIFRHALWEAIIFLAALYLLEVKFGSLTLVVSQISAIVVAFMPTVIIIIGLVFILKSVF